MTDPKPASDATTRAEPGKPEAAPAARPHTDNNAAWDKDDEGENWRHAPVAPKDAGVLDSLGRSVSDAVVGSDAEGERDKGKPPGRG